MCCSTLGRLAPTRIAFAGEDNEETRIHTCADARARVRTHRHTHRHTCEWDEASVAWCGGVGLGRTCEAVVVILHAAAPASAAAAARASAATSTESSMPTPLAAARRGRARGGSAAGIAPLPSAYLRDTSTSRRHHRTLRRAVHSSLGDAARTRRARRRAVNRAARPAHALRTAADVFSVCGDRRQCWCGSGQRSRNDDHRS